MVGNSYLDEMTAKKRFILRFELTSWNNQFRYAEYSNFVVGSLNEKFHLTLGTYSGDAGNLSRFFNSGFGTFLYK